MSHRWLNLFLGKTLQQFYSSSSSAKENWLPGVINWPVWRQAQSKAEMPNSAWWAVVPPTGPLLKLTASCWFTYLFISYFASFLKYSMSTVYPKKNYGSAVPQGHRYSSGHMLRIHAQSYLTLCDPMACSPPGSSVHGILQTRNTGVGCHFLLQGIFLTQGWNLDLLQLLHWQAGSVPPWKPIEVATVFSNDTCGRTHSLPQGHRYGHIHKSPQVHGHDQVRSLPWWPLIFVGVWVWEREYTCVCVCVCVCVCENMHMCTHVQTKKQ